MTSQRAQPVRTEDAILEMLVEGHSRAEMRERLIVSRDHVDHVIARLVHKHDAGTADRLIAATWRARVAARDAMLAARDATIAQLEARLSAIDERRHERRQTRVD